MAPPRLGRDPGRAYIGLVEVDSRGTVMEHEESFVSNPFMLMLHPEEVLAAVERSENLGRLNRRTCHPLDRVAPPAGEDAGQKSLRRRAADLDEDLDGFGVTIN
jgi:hypothetical protein